MTSHREDPARTPATPYLRALGVGGGIGGLLAALVTVNAWWVLLAVVLFVGTAVVDVALHEMGWRA